MTDPWPGSLPSNQGENMPAADVDLDVDVVRRLLDEAVADQNLDPGLAAGDLWFVANGWDNALFRLGTEHVVRLPRRAAAVPLIHHEQRWLTELALRLPLMIPAPEFRGRPTPAFDRPWSIVPWFPGEAFGLREVDDEPARRLAGQLAGFLHDLHRPSPPDAPVNPVRGVPLADRADLTTRILDSDSTTQAAGGLEAAVRLRALWQRALEQPVWSAEARWLHGDLHPLNLVWSPEREWLIAVVDFGDLTGGDPATDLAVAWYLFPDPAQRRRFQNAALLDGKPVERPTWVRAAGWALSISTTLVARSADNPTLRNLGVRTLRALAADPVSD